MNRYPVWKYLLIVLALVLGALYAAPNYFVESPALQITSGQATFNVTGETAAQVADALKQEHIAFAGATLESERGNSFVRVRFTDSDAQFKGKLALEKALNRDRPDARYIVTVNLVKNTPAWMQALHAGPMSLGLDLRGGVHFLMQVNTKEVLNKRLLAIASSARGALREQHVRYAGIERAGDAIELRFNDAATRAAARTVLAPQMADLLILDAGEGADPLLRLTLKPEALKKTIDDGVKQDIATLSKRVNELGTTEPVIAQQGPDRIIVQLPGVQDAARAKDLIGRTAALELHMVDDTVTPGTEMAGAPPLGSVLYTSGKNVPVVTQKEVVLGGEHIVGATASFDQNQRPAVSVDLDGEGGHKMRAASRAGIGKRMAIVLIEKGRPEVLSVPRIDSEFGASFQITGMGTAESANELALLLRSGALYAPMEVIEERLVGPQLGAQNIQMGLYSTLYGFIAIAVFMIAYYRIFGVFSALALAFNLLLLLALLSMLQLTLTLPGIAAIALALGMAIDANVLINERIREELRGGSTPQAAIAAGFDRAWATILDSNVTTLIVGLALLVFGTGPVRGFAVVHCLGILTSMFSAVFVSRGIVNLWYGRKKKLTSLAIGTVWTAAPVVKPT